MHKTFFIAILNLIISKRISWITNILYLFILFSTLHSKRFYISHFFTFICWISYHHCSNRIIKFSSRI